MGVKMRVEAHNADVSSVHCDLSIQNESEIISFKGGDVC